MALSAWTSLIDELIDGRWISPLNGKRQPAMPIGRIVIEESLDGREAGLVSDLGLAGPFAVVSDRNTHAAIGERVARSLESLGAVEEVVLDHPHCDMATVRSLAARLSGMASVVAVGSGTINDLCKYVTFLDGRPYCVFGTAASMNGYVSSTASVTLESGLKVSLPAHAPRGMFIDLSVCAAAPAYLAAAGFGDTLCRPVAQVDWWMSHRLLDTKFMHEPYVIAIPEEMRLMDLAEGVAAGEVEAIGVLVRALTLFGLGVNLTGTSSHGSMGEHQISHYLDCFAGARHPGTIHGEQVGVATLTMARIQEHFLASDTPPELAPTVFDPDDMARRMGDEVARDCLAEIRKKALDEAGADALNRRLRRIWPDLRRECLDMSVPVERLAERLRAAGGKTTAAELGYDADLYREAVCHSHEMRNRYCFTDLAAGTGKLAQLAAHEF